MESSRERRRYLDLMSEIDRRLSVVESFERGSSSTMYVQTTIESQALQLRKVLELIAFSSLIPNRDAYEQVRSDIRKDWHALRILKKVEAVNPRFYPVPATHVSGTGWVLKRHSFLTRREFELLYDRCGSVLHAKNPFSTVSQRSLAFQARIPEHVARVRELLAQHLVKLAGARDWLYVTFPREEDGPFVALWLSGKTYSGSSI